MNPRKREEPCNVAIHFVHKLFLPSLYIRVYTVFLSCVVFNKLGRRILSKFKEAY